MSKEITPANKLIEILKKRFPNEFFKPSSEFRNDNTNGVWCGAEPGAIMSDGFPAFDYYAEDYREVRYVLGVHKEMVALLEEHGYYAEFHDAGTVMLWPE